MSEYQLHLSVASWLPFALPANVPHWHTGQTAINARHGATLKRMGVKPGVPDWTFLLPPNGRAGFIELKDDAGKQTVSQRDFEQWARGAGALYAVCRSIEEVAGTLKGWGVTLRAGVG